MGKQTRQLSEYECDRCGFRLTSDDLAAEEAQLNGCSRRRFSVVRCLGGELQLQGMGDLARPFVWLCADCTGQLKQFLSGTPLDNA